MRPARATAFFGLSKGISMARRWLMLAAFVVCVAAAQADEPVAGFPTERQAAAKRLEQVRQLVAAGDWANALAQIDAVMEEPSGDLIPINKNRSVQSRRLYHTLVASFPPEQLAVYRKRVDPKARAWLEDGEARRDTKALGKVVDLAFCSTYGERALELLGDLAFERGRFDEALSWWGMIRPALGATDMSSLIYPDPHADPAHLHAMQLLARIFRGGLSDPNAEVAGFRAKYAKAEGGARRT